MHVLCALGFPCTAFARLFAKRYLRFYAVPDVHFHFLVWNRSCLEAYAQSIEQLQENSFADLTT